MKFEQLHPADQLVEMMNRIYKYGMTTTSGGNLSVRDKNGDIWITPSGVDKGSLTRDDIMQVKPDGTCIGKHKPSVEFTFHRDIFLSRPDINGIVHAHPPVMVGFSLVHKPLDVRILPEVYHTCGDMERVPYNPPGTPELGRDIAEKFAAGCSTVLMENHGVVCGAKDLMQAFSSFETIVLGASVQLKAMKLGRVNALNDDQIASAMKAAVLPEADEVWEISCEEQKAREQLCAFSRRCYDRKLFNSAWGTLSVRRQDGSMLITPADKDRMNLKPEDIVRIRKGTAEGGKLPGEAVRLHMKIYEVHPEINCVMITHSPAILGYAVAGEKFESRMISESYIILGDVQRVSSESGALNEDQIASMFGRRKFAVVADNRCAIVTGASLINAFDRAEVLEYSAEAIIAALDMGNPVMMTEKEVNYTDRACNIL